MSSFRVLFVCTANHCRSPMAQQMFRHAAAQRFGPERAWQVESAGTEIPGPWPLNHHAVTVLAERLQSVAAHTSVGLDSSAIRRADLILTASRRHRGIVVGLQPAAVGRTFTILQFARLCDAVTEVRSTDVGELGRELVAQAKLARSTLQPVPGELDDLADPIGRGLGAYYECADRLEDAIARILRPAVLVGG